MQKIQYYYIILLGAINISITISKHENIKKMHLQLKKYMMKPSMKNQQQKMSIIMEHNVSLHYSPLEPPLILDMNHLLFFVQFSDENLSNLY